jgi:2OG-Fe(II) oxygenase superfamily
MLQFTSLESRLQAKRKRESTDYSIPELGLPLPTSPCIKRKHLRIDIPALETTLMTPSNDDDFDGLTSPSFSEISLPDSLFEEPADTMQLPSGPDSVLIPALRTVPPIPGLFFTPTLRLPEEVADAVMRFCLDTYFQVPGVNQIMLFGRFSATDPVIDKLDEPSSLSDHSIGLPAILLQLLATLDTMLFPFLPPQTHELLFPRIQKQARQVILNLYDPGEGISPHVDLLRRFGDGIVGVSLGSGCIMQFAKANVSSDEQTLSSPLKERKQWDLYLPERSVVVLSEDARYKWTHGIGKCTEDYVAVAGSDLDGSSGQWIQRDVRLSITFRWLLPGADIVGED